MLTTLAAWAIASCSSDHPAQPSASPAAAVPPADAAASFKAVAEAATATTTATAAACPEFSPDVLQRALMSIEYYAERGRPQLIPTELWVMPVEDALTTLICDPTFGKERRLFRAREVIRGIEEKDPGFLSTLETSSERSVAKLKSMDLDAENLACCAEVTECTLLEPTGSSRLSAVSFMMNVHTPYLEAAEWLDPQRWDDDEGSGFKKIEYLGTKCPISGSNETAPHPIGKGWTGAVLEEFAYNCEEGSYFCTSFRNHLLFDSVLDENKGVFSLVYDLCEEGSLGGSFPGGEDVGTGALEEDCGYTAARVHPSLKEEWTEIVGAKTLVYSEKLCGNGGCGDDGIAFAQRVLVHATAIAMCNTDGAKPGKCKTFGCTPMNQKMLGQICPDMP